MSRIDRRAVIVTVICALAVGAVVAIIATNGSDASATSGRSAAGATGDATSSMVSSSASLTSGAASSREPQSTQQPHYRQLPHLQPGKLIPDPDPIVSSEVMLLIESGWHVGNHWGYTLVNAGQATGDRSKGLFAISRYRVHNDSLKLDLVNVPGAGAVRITKAPVGGSVVTWAQRRGNLQFKSKSGITGTLHLKDDAVTLNPQLDQPK